MTTGTGHTLWHIKWYPRLEREYPDCSHFVVQTGKDYRDAKFHLAVVIADRAAEIRQKLREWERDGTDHPLREFLEEELEELIAEKEKSKKVRK